MSISDLASQLPYCGAAILLLSSVLKVIDLKNERSVITNTAGNGIISFTEKRSFILLLSGIELVIALTIFLTNHNGIIHDWAIVSQVALFSIFTLWCLYQLQLKVPTGCRCFGALSNSQAKITSCIRNVLLAVISVIGYFSASASLSSSGFILIIGFLGLIYVVEMR